MTPKETEAFKRGIMLAFVTTTVRDAVQNAFKSYPDFQGMKIDKNEVASKIIYRTYMRLGISPPTMEEAIINVETIRLVGDEMTKLTLSQDDLYRSESKLNNHLKKNEVTKQPIRKEYYSAEETRKTGMNRLSKKDREELR